MLDHFGKVVEYCQGRLTANHLNFVKRYEEGEVNLVINREGRIGGENTEFDLVFSAIPGRA